MTPALLWTLAIALSIVHLGLSLALGAAAMLSRIALRRMAGENGGRFAFLDELAMGHSSHRLAGTVLRQLCLLGIVAAVAWVGRGAGWSHPVWTAAAGTFVVVVVLLQAGLARTLALWDARRTLKLSAPFLVLAHGLLYPVVVPLTALQRRLERGDPGEELSDEEQDEQVEALIEVGERSGILEAEEGEMVRGIVDLDETLVREIMTPQNRMHVLPVEATVAEAREKLMQAGHSRLPVYEGSIDQVVGVLHARDLFRAWSERRDAENVRAYLRPPVFVQETASAADLLREMRVKTKIAIVVDAFGGVAGLVTLEDLLEEIVGEIREEHEPADADDIQLRPDGSYRVAADTHVEELEELFEVSFGDRDFDTVGGWIVAHEGRVPAPGERLTLDGLQIEVLRSDRRRIDQVAIRPAPRDDARTGS